MEEIGATLYVLHSHLDLIRNVVSVFFFLEYKGCFLYTGTGMFQKCIGNKFHLRVSKIQVLVQIRLAMILTKKIMYRNLYIFLVVDGVISFDDGVVTQ